MTFFTPTPEKRVNTTVIGEQYGSYRSGNMSALDNGNYVVVWTSQDAGVAAIYMQRFDMFGTPIGVETKVNTFTGFDIIPSVTNLTGGGFVVTWTSQNGQDGAGNGVYMQRYDASGVRQGVETLVNTTTTGNQDAARVFSLPAGGYIVVWDGEGSAQDTSNYGVFFQRYDASGNKVGGETLANTTTTNYQDSGSALVNADGSFMVIWESAGQDYGTGYGVYMQRFDATGAKIGSETLVNTTVVNHQLYPTGEVLTGGDIIVTWTSNLQDGSGAGVYTQRFTAAGAKVGGEVLVNTSTNLEQNGSRVTALADGGYIVQWDSNAEDGAHWNIYMQRYDAAGAKVGGESLVNTTTLGDQTQGAVTTLSDGSFVISWQSWGQDQATGWGVYQRIFHAGETYNDPTAGGHIVTGGAGDDIVNGLDGADTLYGGGDARSHDTLNGGDGDDNIYMTGGDTANGGSNNDHIWVTAFTGEALYANGGAGYDIFDITLTTGNSYWQFLDASSIEEYRGNGQNDNFDGSLITVIAPLTLAGNGGNDTLKSGAGNDVLDGGAGNDLLDGGTGTDKMSGRAGNDSYYVDSATDVVDETATGGGDAGGADIVLSSVSYTLGDYVESLALTGAANINGTGNAVANRLVGNTGANKLDGKGGTDNMYGGAGNDTYYVDISTDVVSETNNGADTGGVDTVSSTASFTLGNYLENLVLTGAANINGTGNGTGNRLNGNSGANVLDGRGGADTMAGGAGNDSYYVDLSTDSVSETSNGVDTGGVDVVTSSASFVLANYIETLILTGASAIDATGNAQANRLTGNSGANKLDGKGGADIMAGGAGDDTYIVDDLGDVVTETKNGANTGGVELVKSSVNFVLPNFVENLTLTGGAVANGSGNAVDNILIGNTAANVLFGGGGHDTLTGDLGADRFRFTLGSGLDTITDFHAAENDLVDIHAYTAGVVSVGLLSTVGGDTVINLGGGNVITVVGVVSTDPGLLAHIVW